jgi:hypothetical protein
LKTIPPNPAPLQLQFNFQFFPPKQNRNVESASTEQTFIVPFASFPFFGFPKTKLNRILGFTFSAVEPTQEEEKH